MRDYGKVSPKFWIGKTGKALRKHSQEAQLVGLYLLTGPHANMLGLYYLPQTFIGHEIGIGIEGAIKGLAGCIEAGFCQYDEESETVWVIEMAHYQIATRLSANDKQCKGVQSAYDALPENPFLGAFFDKYQPDFHLTHRRAIEGASEALRSQEQEQEKEQEQKQAQEQDQKQLVERRGASPDRDVVGEIFAYWQKTMNSPKSVLDNARKTLIKNALKNYEPRQICEAILGCSRNPHNMGKNERNTKYNGLGLILRNSEYIEKFIEMASKTTVGEETIEQRNARITAEILGGEDPLDLNVIDMEEAQHED